MDIPVQIDNFLGLLSEYLPDMIWAKDRDGQYLFVNRAICENLLMADSTEEPIGKNDMFFASRERSKYPDNPQWHTFGELCFNSDLTVLEQLRPMRFEEFGNIRGEMVYLEVFKAPLYDANGELIGTIGSGRDITLQKQTALQLLSTSRMIEEGPVVVFEWGVEEGWPVRYVSSNVETILGVSKEALLSQLIPFSELIHPEDLKRVSNEVASYLRKRTKGFLQEYRIVSGGVIKWMEDYTVVEYDDEGNALRISGYLIDETPKKNAEEEAWKAVFMDRLTALPNRQKLQSDIENNAPTCCVIFNLDNFKEVNDFFGIEEGDEILKQVARWFEHSGHKPYRIAGDEFALLFYNVMTWPMLRHRIETMIALFEEHTFHVGSESINLRITAGAVNSKNLALTHADIALHKAKESKVSVVLYEQDKKIEEAFRSNILMASAIRKALLQERIVCYYQPIVDAKTKKIVKYETLVRMIDEEGKLMMPNQFLPIAKQIKLYPRITREVVAQACSLFASRDEQFSVNLSKSDLTDSETINAVFDIIAETGTAEKIVFEILEYEGIENYDEVTRFIKKAKGMGIKIAVDDFGTGYSNFENILKLNIDYIKIDGSLIKGIVENERHRIIVETIVDFAAKIGVQTIAEFVSDKSICEAATQLNIDFLQGYHVGMPEALYNTV